MIWIESLSGHIWFTFRRRFVVVELKKKFLEYELMNFMEPEFIVLEKLKFITKKIVIEKQSYCKSFNGNIYILYLKKNPKMKCD